MEENRAFEEMFQAAKAMLRGKDPFDIAKKAGIIFENSTFLVPSLGKDYRISFPEFTCDALIPGWHHLVILHYLNLADGAPITGEGIPMADLPGGLIRGTKFDRTAAQALTTFLTDKTEAQIRLILSGLVRILCPAGETCAPAYRSCPGSRCTSISGLQMTNSRPLPASCWTAAQATI